MISFKPDCLPIPVSKKHCWGFQNKGFGRTQFSAELPWPSVATLLKHYFLFYEERIITYAFEIV